MELEGVVLSNDVIAFVGELVDERFQALDVNIILIIETLEACKPILARLQLFLRRCQLALQLILFRAHK